MKRVDYWLAVDKIPYFLLLGGVLELSGMLVSGFTTHMHIQAFDTLAWRLILAGIPVAAITISRILYLDFKGRLG